MQRNATTLLTAALFAMLQQPASAQAPPAKVAAAGREPTLQFGGLIQVQAETGDRGDARFSSSNDRFYLRRVRLNAAGRFLEEFDFRLELDAAGSVGAQSGLRAQLTDAFVNWNRYTTANIRVGQFKTAFGFEQLYGDPRMPSIERTLASDRLTLGRQVGLQVGGDLLDKRLSYALGAFNGSGTNNTSNDNNRFSWVGRISGQPWRGRLFGKSSALTVGANGYRSEDSGLSLPDLGIDSTPGTPDRDGLFTGGRRGAGADLQLVAGPFELWAEALRAQFRPTNRFPDRDFEAEGGYLQATCFVWKTRLQLLVKHETFDPLRGAEFTTTTTDTLGFNYFIKGSDLKVMLNYLRVDIDRRPGQEKILARVQVLF